MFNIRHNLFETNSSSMHSICIQRSNDLLNIPEKLELKPGEFGWDCKVLTSPEELGSYLYTAVLELHNDKKVISDWKNYISDACYSIGCEVEFCEPTVDEYGLTNYHIDHGYELTDLINKLRHHQRRLLRFLFGEHSFIITANDNSGYEYFYEMQHKLVDNNVEEYLK